VIFYDFVESEESLRNRGRKRMRALIKENPTEGYELKEIPIPEPGDDELVFKVERVKYYLIYCFKKQIVSCNETKRR
jgi:hypothetical protein